MAVLQLIAKNVAGALRKAKNGKRRALTSRTDRSNSAESTPAAPEAAEPTWHGLSIRYLARLWAKVRSRAEARDVMLFVATEDLCKAVLAGDTIELVEELPTGQLVGRARDGRLVEFSQSQVTAKPRKEWTLDDVVLHVVLPYERQCETTYADSTGSGRHQGRAFRGAFVTCARSSRFGDLVEALCSLGTASQMRDQFVWLEAFGTVHDTNGAPVDDHLCAVLQARPRFEQQIVFVDSWTNPPACFSGGWAARELSDAWEANEGRVSALLAPANRESFSCALVSRPEVVLDALAEFSPAARKAARGLLATSVKDLVSASRQRLTLAPRDDRVRDQLAAELFGAGLVLAELGETTVAIKYQRQSLEMQEAAGRPASHLAKIEAALAALLAGVHPTSLAAASKSAKALASQRKQEQVEAEAMDKHDWCRSEDDGDSPLGREDRAWSGEVEAALQVPFEAEWLCSFRAAAAVLQ